MIYPSRVVEEQAAPGEIPPPAAPELVTVTLGGQAHPITSRSFVIGRSRECDLRVSDGNASRRHAEITREGDSFVLVDLGSTNGTELNGRRISREELANGDRITIGATDLVFGRSRP
jgi:pSer/pThr/pTyr-binding forkhead associated (FHA) protein